jgi:hypothetical protein
MHRFKKPSVAPLDLHVPLLTLWMTAKGDRSPAELVADLNEQIFADNADENLDRFVVANLSPVRFVTSSISLRVLRASHCRLMRRRSVSFRQSGATSSARHPRAEAALVP